MTKSTDPCFQKPSAGSRLVVPYLFTRLPLANARRTFFISAPRRQISVVQPPHLIEPPLLNLRMGAATLQLWRWRPDQSRMINFGRIAAGSWQGPLRPGMRRAISNGPFPRPISSRGCRAVPFAILASVGGVQLWRQRMKDLPDLRRKGCVEGGELQPYS